MPTRCCISNCKNNKVLGLGLSKPKVDVVDHVKYHRFPFKDELLLRKWCNFMGRDYEANKSHRICSHHFDPSCYYRHLNTLALNKDAVPTIGKPSDAASSTSLEVPSSNTKGLHTYKQPRSVESSEDNREVTDLVDIKHETNLKVETDGQLPSLAEFVDVGAGRVIKQEPEEEDVDVDTEFVDVGGGGAPLVVTDAPQGVAEPLCKVEPCEENHRRSPHADPLDSQRPPPTSADLHEDATFACESCAKTFANRKNLTAHAKTHSAARPFACGACGLTFASRGYLTKHSQTHSRRWPFACGDCDRSFRCSALLAAHASSHTGRKPHACALCSRAFSNKYTLSKHVRMLHAPPLPLDRVFVCEHCDKCSPTEAALRQHLLTHTRGRPFRCELCGKCFPTKSYLKHHAMIHSGERLFTCGTCTRGFITGSELRKHVRSHTGEKPFACTMCDMRFACKPNLTRHLAYHSGQKPYPCDVCNKSFTEKNNLARHAKTHIRPVPS